MSNCYSDIPEHRETFSRQQIIEISKSVSEAVEKVMIEQSKSFDHVFKDKSNGCRK